MRRIAGFIAFTLGCLFLFLGPLVYFYTKPRVEKAPTDIYDVTLSYGTGDIFRATTTHLEGPLPLVNRSISKSNFAKSTDRIAVISISDHAVDRQTGTPINDDFTVYAMDRSTGLEVHCGCGETSGIEGQTLKFPFGTKKDRVYQFFDLTTHKAFPARYVRTETIAGLSTYLFQSDVPPTRIGTIDVPGALIGSTEKTVTADRWAKGTTMLWVEPFTGAIVKAGQISEQWLTNGDQYALTLSNTIFFNSDASIQHTADQVRTKLGQLRIAEFWVPFFGPPIGVVLAAVGLFLLWPSRRMTRTFAPQPAEVGT